MHELLAIYLEPFYCNNKVIHEHNYAQNIANTEHNRKLASTVFGKVKFVIQKTPDWGL